MADKLRLKAGDAEDLGVISAGLQDARITVEGDGVLRPTSGASRARSTAIVGSASRTGPPARG